MRRIRILGLVALLATATPALALLCSGTVSILGAGPSQGVVVIDDLAIIGAGPDLVAFDITNPAEPVRIGSTRFGGSATPVGSYEGHVLAFVAGAGSNRLAVIDPNPGGSPQEVSSVPLPDRLRPDDLVVVGDIAWIVTSDHEEGLLGVDLGNPAIPVLATRFALAEPATRVTAVDGHLLLIAYNGLLIADVSDPAAPEIVGSLTIERAQSAAAASGVAYVASLYALHAIDIADFNAPSIISTMALERDAVPLSMAVADDHLIVGLVDYDPMIAPPDGGMRTYDISDPRHPVAIADTRFSSGPRALTMSQDAIVAADAERGLRIFNPDPSGGHDEIARRNITMDDAFGVAIHDDLAYLGDQGLRVIDVSDHRNPQTTASVELDGEIAQLAINEAGDRIAALALRKALHLFDASEPEVPVLTASVQTDGWYVDVSGDTLAIAEAADGWSLIDISNPEHPEELSRVQTSGQALSVAIDGDIAVVGMLVTGGFGSMAVYDVGDPSNPILLSQMPTQQRVSDIDLGDSTAAIVAWDTVIYYDLNDPTAPVELGRFSGKGQIANGLALDGDRVHLSSWPGGLRILDFSTANTPRQVIRTWWFPAPIVDGGPLGGYDIAVHEGASIIADGRFGLRIFEVKRCLPRTDSNQASATVD